MNYYIGSMSFSDGNDLLHYGVKGMKWGVRNYNKDGSLTEKGLYKQDLEREKLVNRQRKSYDRKLAKISKQREKLNVKEKKISKRLNIRLSAIKGMSLKDINKMKVRKGLAIIGGIIAGASIATLASIGAYGALSLGLGVAENTAIMTTLFSKGASVVYGVAGGITGGIKAPKKSERKTVNRHVRLGEIN